MATACAIRQATANWRILVSTPPPNSIEALIRRAQRGDSTAVTELYEMHVEQIYRYVAYRVPDNEAEDITSDVFINMVESLPSFTYTGAPFEAWLYRIASARIADFLGVDIPGLHIPTPILKLAATISEYLADKTETAPLLTKSQVEFLTIDHGTDITSISECLGFKPSVDFRTGIKLTLEWAAEEGLI